MNYKSNMISGSKWVTFYRVFEAILSILKISLLTRFIDKPSFGLFAISIMLVNFSNLFVDMGISVSLFSKKEISQRAAGSLYWLNIALSLVLYITLVFLSKPLANYFEEPILEKLIPIISLNILLIAAYKYFEVFAEKRLLFKKAVLINVIATIVTFAASIYMAVLKYQIHALIVPILIGSIVKFLCFFYAVHKYYTPKFCFDIKEIKPFFNIGIFEFFSQILDYFSKQIDILIISKLLGTEALGVYSLIKQLAYKIFGLITATIAKVAIPLFSYFSEDQNLIKTRFLNILKLASQICAVIYFSVSIFSKETLILLYGESYAEHHMILTLFALTCLMSLPISLFGILIVIKGQSKKSFYWTVFRVLVSAPLIYIASKLYLLEGIAWSQLIFSIAGFYVYYYFVLKRIQDNISLKSLYSNFLSPSLAPLTIFILITLIDFKFQINLLSKIIIYTILMTSYVYSNRETIKKLPELLSSKQKKNLHHK